MLAWKLDLHKCTMYFDLDLMLHACKCRPCWVEVFGLFQPCLLSQHSRMVEIIVLNADALVATLSFSIVVMNSRGAQLTFTSNTESLMVNSLECCTQYSYQVVARASGEHEASSEWFSFMTYGLNKSELVAAVATILQ